MLRQGQTVFCHLSGHHSPLLIVVWQRLFSKLIRLSMHHIYSVLVNPNGLIEDTCVLLTLLLLPFLPCFIEVLPNSSSSNFLNPLRTPSLLSNDLNFFLSNSTLKSINLPGSLRMCFAISISHFLPPGATD